MSRVEDNKKLVKHFIKEVSNNPKGTFEEMLAWHLGTINSFLTDISISLAVIADSMSREDGDAE